MGDTDVSLILQAIQSAGMLGILAFFIGGYIQPTKIVDKNAERIKAHTELMATKIADQLGKEIKDGIQDAIKMGIVEAVDMIEEKKGKNRKKSNP
jgi:hypothetical protein